ncbi:hypothetical protein TRICI_005155 [Trichomonascus ciferrii]|uniref:Uncharacterized protein n=1 Tax=Trichomonascus ciferrii TaxID=44093 RepID=A0A642UVP5_9ASCO|nr:hypothetical protein TRICI_005155 [Trichomonascus ciferrii]
MVKSLNIAAVTSLTLAYLASAAPVENAVEDSQSHALAETDDQLPGDSQPAFYKASPALKNSKVEADDSDPNESFDEIGAVEAHRKRDGDAGPGVILDPIHPEYQEEGSRYGKRDNKDPPDVTVLDAAFSVDPVGPPLPQGDIDPAFSKPVQPRDEKRENKDSNVVYLDTQPANPAGLPDGKDIDPGFYKPVKPKEDENQDPSNVIDLDPQPVDPNLGDDVDPGFQKPPQGDIDPGFSKPVQTSVPKQPRAEKRDSDDSNVIDLDPQPVDPSDLQHGEDIDPGFYKPVKPSNPKDDNASNVVDLDPQPVDPNLGGDVDPGFQKPPQRDIDPGFSKPVQTNVPKQPRAEKRDSDDSNVIDLDPQPVDPSDLQHGEDIDPGFYKPVKPSNPKDDNASNVVDLDPQPVDPNLGGDVDPGFQKPPQRDIDPGFSKPVQTNVPKQPRAEKRDSDDSNVIDLDPQPVDPSDLQHGEDIDPGFYKPVKPSNPKDDHASNVIDLDPQPVVSSLPTGDSIDPGFHRPPQGDIDPGFSKPVQSTVPKQPRSEKRDNQDSNVIELDPNPVDPSPPQQADEVDPGFARPSHDESVDPGFYQPSLGTVPKQPRDEQHEKRQDSPSMLQPEGPLSTVGDNISPNNRDATGWADDVPHAYYVRPQDNPYAAQYNPRRPASPY